MKNWCKKIIRMTGEKMRAERNINIEILRIILMVMILILHFFYHGNILNEMSREINLLNISIISIEVLCIVAVNVFILISGYFLCKSKFDINKIIKLYGEIFVYSIIIGLILLLINNIELNIKNLLYIFFPFITQRYWFFNAYILLLLLFPFLNVLINNISKEKFKLLLILLFLINSILPIGIKNSVSLNSANSLFWFLNLYLMGGYIRINNINLKKKYFLCSYIIFNIFFIIVSTTVYIIGGVSRLMYVLKYNLPFTYISSILLFMIVLNTNFKLSNKLKKIIMFFSKSTFAVYIIHENPFIRNLLWNELLNTSKYYFKYGYIYMIAVVLMIYIFCTLIDKCVQKIYKKMKLNSITNDKINNKFI